MQDNDPLLSPLCHRHYVTRHIVLVLHNKFVEFLYAASDDDGS